MQDLTFYKQSNFLEFKWKINYSVFLKFIIRILRLYKNKKHFNNILLINISWPFFWWKFINNIILIYCHILKIKVYIMNYWVDIKKDNYNVDVTLHKLIEKILSYKIDVTFVGKTLNNKLLYDKVIINNEVPSLYFTSIIETIKQNINWREYIFFLDFYNKIDFWNIITRQEFTNILFSKIIIDTFSKKINFFDRKYDVVIAWSFKGRDYNMVKKLLEDFKTINIAIIYSNYTDYERIKSLIWEWYNINYIFNDNSYLDFLDVINNSKIYLNCINKWEETFWSTWILIPANIDDIIIVSKYNKFYSNKILNAYFYNNYNDLKNIIDRILNKWEICYNKTSNNLFIEEIIEKEVFNLNI